ncbi:MAG: methyltransferase domain-containing protein [Actinomycetota bacterium]|nr:methyltransferase domain-containing protein [Actinomycetota bacterium]
MTNAAATRWAQALAEWALPAEILDQAATSPWEHPVKRFADRADDAASHPGGWSYERAGSALPPGGSVLDVGVGAGAASLPLARRASRITGVDCDARMLAAFTDRVAATPAQGVAVEGTWPDVAGQVGPHDVAVAHHVAYNVADLVPFLRALTDAAIHGVVVELPPRHPMSWANPLWRQFWDLDRPTGPTADDFVAVVTELGVTGLVVYRWTRDDPDLTPLDERAALVAQRLCLPNDRVGEVRDAIAGLPPNQRRDVVTVAWDGSGSR